MPIHHNGNHWILVHVDMRVGREYITVYDSLRPRRGSREWDALLGVMDNVACLIRTETGRDIQRHEISPFAGQQVESWECGVFLLGNAACTILSPTSFFTQAIVANARLFILHTILERSLAPLTTTGRERVSWQLDSREHCCGYNQPGAPL